jgi:serine/threonine protein phosphatase PrpC
MLCPWCQTPNRENAKFCKGCGQTLAVETVAGGPQATRQDTQPAPAQDVAPSFTPTPSGATPPPPPPPPESLKPPTVGVENSAASSHATTGTPDNNDPNDPYRTPTQTLTAEQKEQQRLRRKWLEQHGQGSKGSGGLIGARSAAPFDISDAPTILAPFPPTPAPAPLPGEAEIAPTVFAPGGLESDLAPTIYASPVQESDIAPTLYAPSSEQGIPDEQTVYAGNPEPEQEAHSNTTVPSSSNPEELDIADQPTMLMPMESTTSAPDEAPTQAETPTLEEAEAEQQAQASQLAAEHTDEPVEAEQTTPAEETPQPGGEEVRVDSEKAEETGTTPEQTPDTVTNNDFPVLAIGSVIGERYEITQVVSQEEHEHVYEVADQKGYLHCWNCNSEENTEGDEFCNDCGAELLNAAYLMHEYASGKASGESVLQGAIVGTLIEQGHTYVIELPQTLQSNSLNGVHLVASNASDVGVARQPGPNEDSTLQILLERVHESISSPAGIFLVSDGMGGHANGQLASRMTAGIIAEHVIHDLVMPPLEAEKAGEATKTPDGERLKEILRDAIDGANSAICGINTRDKSDMGATLTGFMIVGERAYIFNVGDSRTYMLRDGKLYQLTNDHSLVGQLVAGGLIAPEDVYTHPQRSQIYRSIGDKLNVQIDVTEQVIHAGDILLSCSDGLWEMVRDPQITDILNTAPDPQAACAQLIEAANNNGGEDNISAVVVFVR